VSSCNAGLFVVGQNFSVYEFIVKEFSPALYDFSIFISLISYLLKLISTVCSLTDLVQVEIQLFNSPQDPVF